jgi:RPA family protein
MPGQELQPQKRQTAYKIRIKEILESEYIKNEGMTPNYLKLNSKEVSRLNVVGVIVQKSDSNDNPGLMIDDGTARISARMFEDNSALDNVDVGDVVLVIGRPREFSSEKYIVVEVIKKIDPGWARVRKLELEKGTKEKSAGAKSIKAETDIESQNPKDRIIKLIKDLDKGDGVCVEDLSSGNVDQLDRNIDMLLKEGDIFEVRPGKLKVLE